MSPFPIEEERFQWLTPEELLDLHRYLVSDQEQGTQGILSLGNMMMSLEAPNINVFGTVPYAELHEKVAKLMHEIVTLHPFIDGNKRTGFMAGVVTLDLNGYDIDCPQD